MTNEQFDALVKLIQSLPNYQVGILAGASNRDEVVRELIDNARQVVVTEIVEEAPIVSGGLATEQPKLSLREIRRELGLTQVELGNALDLTQATISRMERGEIPIDRRMELALELLVKQKASNSESEGDLPKYDVGDHWDSILGQLTRYGGGPDATLLPLLDLITDINDDINHDRALGEFFPKLISEIFELKKALIDEGRHMGSIKGLIESQSLINGYYRFSGERVSHKAIAQYIDGQWFCINEEGPVTLAVLKLRGWELETRVEDMET